MIDHDEELHFRSGVFALVSFESLFFALSLPCSEVSHIISPGDSSCMDAIPIIPIPIPIPILPHSIWFWFWLWLAFGCFNCFILAVVLVSFVEYIFRR
jgi:hypothetical protein